ncbi:RadC family protein [Streptomyces sp. PT12]|uniref:JAB domain-containing protein n=1 Tax=Streptomyces sp. PT12 TaxID=1510197 RepID=UPI000DE540F5|nr:DNA repair protein RadC [Streptomyces sp. PT12]RBM22528.1 DNA repair protein [Streptomyces sp. PT12]
MRVTDMPAGDRPRERLWALGAEALADRELLALLLGSGTRGRDAVELAGELIAAHGGLRGLARADPQALVGLPGMGPAKAVRVAAAFHLARRVANEGAADRCRIVTTADLATAAAPLLRGLRHERVVVVVCDTADTVLRTARLTDGASDRNLIPVRDVLALVLASGGSSFGVAHNHPTGDPTPSGPDRRATTRLREAAAAVGLRFLDHVVVTDDAWRRVTTDL